mgnify:CR=1 FL=1
MIRTLIFLLFSFHTISTLAQKVYKYEIVDIGEKGEYVYVILNQDRDTVKKLNPDNYIVTLQPKFNEFAIFSIKGKKGWSAIDLQENYLFQVYNRLPNESFPDYLIEDRIRIVGENGLIGFADSSGKIIIEPKFESVSEFNNGFAIFESDCEKVHNNQEGEHSAYTLECEKVGYIDKDGKILSLENISFEKLKRRINWNGNQW